MTRLLSEEDEKKMEEAVERIQFWQNQPKTEFQVLHSEPVDIVDK